MGRKAKPTGMEALTILKMSWLFDALIAVGL
jgi:hypothetical protein